VGVSAALAGAFLAPAEAAPQLFVDGKAVHGAHVYWVGGHAMVPMRSVVGRMKGTRVHFDPARQRAMIIRGKQRVDLNLYSGYARVGGQAVPLQVPTVTRDKQALIPLRFVSEVLGGQVRYEPGRKTFSIRSGRPGINVAAYRSIPPAAGDPGRVVIGGIVVFTLPTAGEYGSLQERADAVTAQLTEATPEMTVQGRFNPHGLWIRTASGDPVILGRTVPILRVTAADAEKSGKSQQQLAQEWLSQMRAGLRRVYGRG